MAIFDLRSLRQRASELDRANRAHSRKLVLVYCGVLALLSLGGNALMLLVDAQMEGTGGLGGLGMRSVLQTIEEALYYGTAFFGPFWAAGFAYSMLHMVRGRAPELKDLTQGFRRFGRILGATLYQVLLSISMVLATATITALLTAPLVKDPVHATLAETLVVDGVWLVIFLTIFIRILYSFRMSVYLMMDRQIGGVASLFLSRRLMRGHKRRLFRLDLSYWWYYLLGMIFSVVGYLDAIFMVLGIELPVDPTVLFFGTMIVYFVLNTALSLWKKCEVDAACMLFYEEVMAGANLPQM